MSRAIVGRGWREQHNGSEFYNFDFDNQIHIGGETYKLIKVELEPSGAATFHCEKDGQACKLQVDNFLFKLSDTDNINADLSLSVEKRKKPKQKEQKQDEEVKELSL